MGDRGSFRSPPIALPTYGDRPISILSRIFGKGPGSAQTRGLFLGAFGKHPGWDDHIDDLGLETDRLVDLKSLLYVEGIGSRIDSGVWDKLESSQQVDGFSHTFLLRARGDWTFGRLWTSSDGKGRTRYPMVLACQVVGAPLEWVMREVAPQVEALQKSCEATPQAQAVVSAVNATRADLRQKFTGVAAGLPDLTVNPSLALDLADQPDMGPARLGMHRVLYQIEREMSPYLVTSAAGKAHEAEPRPQQLRVPRGSGTGEDALLRWMRFLLLKIDPNVPILMFVPTADSWLDVIVGEPSGSQLFCLRATPKSIPLTTDIPYSLDPGFVAAAQAWLETTRTLPAIEIRATPRPRRAKEGGRFT